MFREPSSSPEFRAGRRWPQATLRSYLIAIILVATLPLALLTSVRIVAEARQQREVLLSSLRSTARAVAMIADRELMASRDALAALAEAEALYQGDVAGFERRLRARGPLRPSWSHLTLLSAAGEKVFEIEAAADRNPAPTPPAELAALASAMASAMAAQPPGAVLISVLDDVVAAQRGTWLGVPAQAADGTRYLLAARVGLNVWQALLDASAPEGGAYVTLFDAQHRVLARTVEAERFAAQALPASAVAGMGSAPAGSQKTELIGGGGGAGGDETYVAWQRLRAGGWGVGAGVPVATFESEQRSAMLWTWCVAAACLLLGLGLALRVARRVAEPLQRLLLGRTHATREPIEVTEIAHLRDAFDRAENEREISMTRETLARNAADSASRAKDELLAILGHELRNPLNAIVTSVEVLRGAAPGSEVAESARGVVTRQSRKLALLIDDLLDMGRVMSDQATMALHPLELQVLVRAGVTAALPRAEARRHRLVLEAGSPVWVRGDARRIGQVMSHLLDNAIKHTPAGGTIAVTLALIEGHAVVRVEDSGPNTAAQPPPRPFEPFGQGQRGLDKASGGMGIGLALVRRLVELHEGSLQAHSSARGNSFECRFPVITPPAGATSAAACRIGVVDDNPDALISMRAMLELAGHAVYTAADGPAGVAMILAERPDVALIDIGLPGMDGYELARRCRAAGFAGRIIAITGYGQTEDRQRSAAEGFDAHLVKPIEPERLLPLLRAG